MTRPSARSRTSIEHPEDGVQHPLPNRASLASRSISETTFDNAHPKLIPSSWLPGLDPRGRWRTRSRFTSSCRLTCLITGSPSTPSKESNIGERRSKSKLSRACWKLGSTLMLSVCHRTGIQTVSSFPQRSTSRRLWSHVLLVQHSREITSFDQLVRCRVHTAEVRVLYIQHVPQNRNKPRNSPETPPGPHQALLGVLTSLTHE